MAKKVRSNIFTKSWIGAILNPIQYFATRQSSDNAAAAYYTNTPINLAGINTSEDFAIYKANWINGCASKLKSADVGKSLANASAACEQNFNNDPQVQEMQQQVNEQKAKDDQEAKEQQDKILKILIFLLLVGIAVFIIIKKL